jgi:hypothetical protein
MVGKRPRTRQRQKKQKMATATKKKPAKAKAKGKVKKSVFDIGTAAKKSEAKSKKSELPVSSLPDTDNDGDYSLAEKLDMLAAAKSVADAAMRKVGEFEAEIKKYLLRDYAVRFAKEGTRPDSRKWKGLRSVTTYVMNSQMTFSHEKMEAVSDELGIDLTPHLEFDGFKVDFSALSENEKWMEAFEEFASKVGDGVVTQKLKFKKGFFDKLVEVCGEDAERILRFMEIVPPRPNLKSVRHSDKEETLFDLVKDLDG